MARLPMMEINAEASYILPAHILVCIHQGKKFVRLVPSKELRIQKFGHPIHLMSVSKIKRDLDILVGIVDHNDAVIVNVFVFPFAFEKNDATRLYFSCSEVCLLKK